MTSSRRRSILSGLALLSATPIFQQAHAKAPKLPANEALVKELYRVAEARSLDADKFVSFFAEDGYFLDMSSGQRWTGGKVREPVAGLIAAYPDMHRELLSFHSSANGVVVVELKLQGTHKGDLPLPDGILRATNIKFDVPCCDVWQLKDGKVKSFHCYNNLVGKLRAERSKSA